MNGMDVFESVRKRKKSYSAVVFVAWALRKILLCSGQWDQLMNHEYWVHHWRVDQ